MSELSYMDLALRGEALLDDIDDFVEAWHVNPSGRSLDEALGFDEAEGDLWASRPESLRFIIAARRQGRPPASVIEEFATPSAIAARSSDFDEAAQLQDWLRRTGRI